MDRNTRHDFQKLKLHRYGGDVLVDMSVIPGGWKLLGKSNEVRFHVKFVAFVFVNPVMD